MWILRALTIFIFGCKLPVIMTREMETPKINEDEERLAKIGIVEVSRMRIDQLPRINTQHAEEDKKLLKNAVAHLNRLRIFPTVELINPIGENGSETVSKNLLFVTNIDLHTGFSRDYFLNPAGELLSYLKIDEHTVDRDPASDRDYINHTSEALLAIENRIRDAMKSDKPKLRLIKDDIGQKLFSGTARPKDVQDWIRDNPHS